MLGFWICAPVIVFFGWVVFVKQRNVRELERRIHTLEPLVAVDPMTGLFNRRGLSEHAARVVSRALRQGDRHVCAAYIDVNFLKRVNDTHGHDAGDQYLLAVRDAMVECFKRADDIVARVGGDEFVVLFPCKDKKDAARVLLHFHSLIRSRAIHVGEETIPLSVSMGGSILTVRPKPISSPSIPRLATHMPSNPVMAKLVVVASSSIQVNGGRDARSSEGQDAIQTLLDRHLALADDYMNLAKREGKNGIEQIILDGVLIPI